MSETRVVHVKDDVEGAVYIGRPIHRHGRKGHPLRNKFRVDEYGRAGAINAYRNAFFLTMLNELQPAEDKLALAEAVIALRGKPLGCWCRHDGEPKTPENACHGDVLIEILDTYTDEQLRAFATPDPVAR